MMEAGLSRGQEAAQGGPRHLLPRELGRVCVLQLAESHILLSARNSFSLLLVLLDHT